MPLALDGTSPIDGLPEDLLVFGLGSNVGDSERRLRDALASLQERFGPLRVASPYRSAPISPIAQADFLNTVAVAALPEPGASLEEDLRSVLALAKALERRAGRRPGPQDGPRPLDVDLLLWGDARARFGESDGPEPRNVRWPGAVEVPHPRLAQRRFVLEPLVELLPELRLPGGGRAADLLVETLGQDVQREHWKNR